MAKITIEEFKHTMYTLFQEEYRKLSVAKIKDQRGMKKGVKRTTVLGSKRSDATKVTLNIFEGHYFIEKRTPYTRCFVLHRYLYREDIPDDYSDMFMEKNKWRRNSRDRTFMMTGDLVRTLWCIDRAYDEFDKLNYTIDNEKWCREVMENGWSFRCFEPLTWNDCELLKTTFINSVDDRDYELNYNDKFCTKLIEYPKKFNTEEPESYWYADFETDVSGENHKPFMCCVQSLIGIKRKQRTFKGEDCDIQFLEYLPDKACVYFHNLAYDIRMIAKYGLKKSITKGTKVFRGEIEYNGKKIFLRDTLPILSCKLSALPYQFGFAEEVQKELFPYKYYTLERLKTNIGVIEECGKEEDKIWTEEDMETFKKNIDSIPGCRLSETTFDMYAYAEFYCQQDVTILRKGFNAFREGFMFDFGIDPFQFITISSLADEVFKQRVYYPNGNLYSLGGVVRKFCANAVHGGRCMCAYNKKWKLNVNITDYDAVSLYPSAMARLYTVEGKPEVINIPNHDVINNIPEFLSKYTAYVVEIEITKVNKHYAFPLIVRKVDDLNLNDDNIDQPLRMTVDDIFLEDLVNFQEIEFKVIRGYGWTGKKDYRIQEEIKNIFYKRKEYKKEGNSLEQLYKLIMNSTYGKCIQKPVETEIRYIKDSEIEKFWWKHYNKIIEDVELSETNIHAVKMLKRIDKCFNNSLLGIHILSMSKRIMSEVMCLAFDEKCRIYYQDTDSFMIECDDLPRLEQAFEKKYNRPLRGSDLGQFHPDFKEINGEVPISVQSVFCGKKLYMHKLQNSKGEIDYHLRGKGLTQQSIKALCKPSPLDLYTRLYDGEAVTFDLTEGQPCFSMNKDMTVSTKKEFLRNVKVNLPEGVRDKYF